jgi:outer membrane protein assembly factor BamD
MRRKIAVFGIVCLVLSLGCSRFRTIEKSQDWRVKFEAAMNYFDKKDYYRASVLFDAILPIVRGLPEGEQVQFRSAYCQYYSKYYLLAAEQFKSFYEIYGRSQNAEEARYMAAYSLYRSSPTWNLDQTSSVEAMTSMQTFLNRYPNSTFRDKAIEVIYTIQDKMERKGFENARQYVKIRQYKAAIVALNDFMQNFPDSKFIEQAAYLIIEAQYELARKSVIDKQPERFRDVVQSYQTFVDRYPDSEYLKDAEKMYADSLEKSHSTKQPNS